MKKKIMILSLAALLIISYLCYFYISNLNFKKNISSINTDLELDIFAKEIDKVLSENKLSRDILVLEEAKTFTVNGGYELDIPTNNKGKIVIFRLDNDANNIQAFYVPPEDMEGDVIPDEESEQNN